MIGRGLCLRCWSNWTCPRHHADGRWRCQETVSVSSASCGTYCPSYGSKYPIERCCTGTRLVFEICLFLRISIEPIALNLSLSFFTINCLCSISFFYKEVDCVENWCIELSRSSGSDTLPHSPVLFVFVICSLISFFRAFATLHIPPIFLKLAGNGKRGPIMPLWTMLSYHSYQGVPYLSGKFGRILGTVDLNVCLIFLFLNTLVCWISIEDLY